ncbi:TniQ family protein, partial [Cytobacillus sp. Bac17]|uniref:TniQ family protein n=1 Tax=Cytobacillus sp. Bac17 TaxID=2926008 RepID=UPI002117E667
MLTINYSKQSVLYSIKPEKIGTPYVESLTSYISRLAIEHCVSTGDLISKLVTPIIGKKYLSNISKKGGDGFYKSTSGINGIGQLAEEFTNLLSNLTLRSDLEDTTLLTWNTVFPTRGLSKNRKHWCPCCFQESLENNKPIYEQLIWCIQPYQNCCRRQVEFYTFCSFYFYTS